MFLGSSAVEQPAVNRLVASSNLARGAILLFLRARHALGKREMFLPG